MFMKTLIAAVCFENGCAPERERSRGGRGPGRVDGRHSARVSRQSGRVLPPAVKLYWLSSLLTSLKPQQIPCFTAVVLRISNKKHGLFWNWVSISTNPFQRQYCFLIIIIIKCRNVNARILKRTLYIKFFQNGDCY